MFCFAGDLSGAGGRYFSSPKVIEAAYMSWATLGVTDLGAVWQVHEPDF